MVFRDLKITVLQKQAAEFSYFARFVVTFVDL